MTDLGFYEKVIPQISKRKLRVLKAISYLLCAIAIILWSLQSMLIGRSFVWIFLVALLIICVPVLIFGFLCTELELSVTQNEITLAKIYGKRSRKELFCIEAEDIISIIKKSEDSLSSLKEKDISLCFSALSRGEEENVWLLLFRYDKEQNACLELALEDEPKKLIRAMRPSAFSAR
jgi:hypothetical protein